MKKLLLIIFALAFISCTDDKCSGRVEDGQFYKPLFYSTDSSFTCGGLEREWPKRNYNLEAFNASVLAKIKLKLVEDGTAPDWAPKTITVTGMVGCTYNEDINPPAGTDCLKAEPDPALYYGAEEQEIRDIITAPKENNPVVEWISVRMNAASIPDHFNVEFNNNKDNNFLSGYVIDGVFYYFKYAMQ